MSMAWRPGDQGFDYTLDLPTPGLFGLPCPSFCYPTSNHAKKLNFCEGRFSAENRPLCVDTLANCTFGGGLDSERTATG